jgi:hypothetical protein
LVGFAALVAPKAHLFLCYKFAVRSSGFQVGRPAVCVVQVVLSMLQHADVVHLRLALFLSSPAGQPKKLNSDQAERMSSPTTSDPMAMAAWRAPAPMAVAFSRPSPLRTGASSIAVSTFHGHCQRLHDLAGLRAVLGDTTMERRGAAPSPALIKTNTCSSPSMSSSSLASDGTGSGTPGQLWCGSAMLSCLGSKVLIESEVGCMGAGS